MLLGFLEKSRYSDCVVICQQQKVLDCPCEVLHACLVEVGTQTMTKLSKKFTDIFKKQTTGANMEVTQNPDSNNEIGRAHV